MNSSDIKRFCKQLIAREKEYSLAMNDIEILKLEMKMLEFENYRLKVEGSYALKLAKQFAEGFDSTVKDNVLRNLAKLEELVNKYD